jgi:flavin reductase (DIM6/NTAB) family NADH-FMN oxidoreductase RutF
MGRLAAGVSVVTSINSEGDPSGLTATAVCSVSLEPPMVLACLATSSATHDAVMVANRFAINFLARDQADLARRFSTSATDKFDDVEWLEGLTGCPVFPGVLAACECELDRSVAAGDHTVFLGRVVTIRSDDEHSSDPLVYFRGAYGISTERDGP